jgi:imidazolonepropionase-like amidohydrolase
VIKNGAVITGTGADPILDGVVVIQADRIVAVGRLADFAIPASARVIDAKGGTILPGIINAHVHGAASPSVRLLYFSRMGVTSVCDMASQLRQMPLFAQQHAAGPAARGFKCGPIVTVPGGYPDNVWHNNLNYDVTSPAEARSAVADLVGRGADVIKVALEPGGADDPWPMLNLPQVQAIVQEAHTLGRLVRAHVGRINGTDVLDIVLKAGVYIVDHVPLPVFSALEEYNLIKDTGRITMTPEYQDQLASLAKAKVIMVPTLTAHSLWCEAPNLTSQQTRLCYEAYQEPVRLFHSLGGAVALANDYGADDSIEKGMPLREMQLLLGAGLTPMEVIEAGTRIAATVCGHGDKLGTLEPGRLADVIIVDGNPLVDIAAMTRVMVVIVGGQIALPGNANLLPGNANLLTGVFLPIGVFPHLNRSN